MYKILFYVEPAVVRDHPLEMILWTDWIEAMIRASRLAGTGDSFAFISNSQLCNSLKSRLGDDLEWCKPLANREILEAFDYDRHLYFKDLFELESAETVNTNMLDLLKQAAESFQPDFVISFNQNRYLRKAFNSSALLFTEMSPMSRQFAAHSLYFDPISHQRESMLVTKLEDILDAPLAPETTGELNELYQKYFLEPVTHHFRYRLISEYIEKVKKGRKLVLFPLQPNDWPTYEGAYQKMTFDGQIMNWLSKLPEDWAAVITYRINMPYPLQLQQHILSEWPNAIFLPSNLSFHSSEYLMPHVEAVAAISSTVGIHSWLWGKPVAAMGNSNLSGIGNNSISNLDTAPEITKEQSMSMLRFLTHKYIHSLERLTCDGNYLHNFLHDWKNAGCGSDYFMDVENWTKAKAEDLLKPVNAEDRLAIHQSELRLYKSEMLKARQELKRASEEKDNIIAQLLSDYDHVIVPRCITIGTFKPLLQKLKKLFFGKTIVVLEANFENLLSYPDDVKVLQYFGKKFLAETLRTDVNRVVNFKDSAVVIPLNNDDGKGFEQLLDFARNAGFSASYVAVNLKSVVPLSRLEN